MHLQSVDSSIYVAGHAGLVGSAVVKRLRSAGFDNLITRTLQQLDLRNQEAVNAFFEMERPAFVIMAAARVGGIMANDAFPADFLVDNLAIQLNVLQAARTASAKRVVFLGSSCIYPKLAPQPLKESYLLTGPLEPTNQWYAVAKIAGIKMCQAFRRQHGSDFISLMPTNMYGPGDNFDLATSHVLPALIRKFHEAKVKSESDDTSVTLWGTGRPRREFLYNEDLADACLFVLQQPESTLYDVAPDGMLNVGVGEDIEIGELALLVRNLVGARCDIVHDLSKPDGTPRKLMSTERLTKLGWRATTSLEQGISRTYAWYVQNETASTR